MSKTKKENKTEVIKLRVTPSQIAHIKKLAKKFDLSVSAFVRKKVLGLRN